MKSFTFEQHPKHHLSLDPGYLPLVIAFKDYHQAVEASGLSVRVGIALERSQGQIATYETVIFSNEENKDVNITYIERLIKTLLWLKGGFRLYIGGPTYLGQAMKDIYSSHGIRAFDQAFMSRVYEQPFEVMITSFDHLPKTNEQSKPIGRHLEGYRIGFDAGGSDRKVSAVVNGEAIYSEEIVWHPKLHHDPQYHIEGVKDSLMRAASKLPRVDAIGVSAAGIYIDNKTMVGSLYIGVSDEDFNQKIKTMYLDIAKDMGDIPIEVANDGDVTALAGAMSLGKHQVLGIAMGTSQAAGYVDEHGNITGWLNELAFVPVDLNPDAEIDPWSKDRGVGVEYFSQEAIIKLAKSAGIELDEDLSPANKLKTIQHMMSYGDSKAESIYLTMGSYLAYGIAYYSLFYKIQVILILGRVTSGRGGEIMVEVAKAILNDEFPELARTIDLVLPDEHNRRVGQSIAAASLPEIKK